MKRVIAILTLTLILSQAKLFPFASLSGGSASPPGEFTDQADNPYYSFSFLPAPSASSSEAENRKKFDDFKKKNGKVYQNAQTEAYRLKVFLKNMKNIDDFNKGPNQGWKKVINKFTDLEQGQFIQKYLMKSLPPAPKGITAASSDFPVAGVAAIDWTTKGKVGAIKDQGACGSCWAFSTVGTIQSNVAIKKSASPATYSEEQLVDCCFKYGFCNPDGCAGGWPANAFNYLGSKGLASSTYLYTAFNGVASSCKQTSYTRTYYLKSPYYNYVSSTSMATKLLSGPLSVCVDASKWSDYGSGIFKCSTTVRINHAVVLVGVDSIGNWKVRNSWGAGWGEAGYIRISANKSNNCGIAQYAAFPILK